VIVAATEQSTVVRHHAAEQMQKGSAPHLHATSDPSASLMVPIRDCQILNIYFPVVAVCSGAQHEHGSVTAGACDLGGAAAGDAVQC